MKSNRIKYLNIVRCAWQDANERAGWLVCCWLCTTLMTVPRRRHKNEMNYEKKSKHESIFMCLTIQSEFVANEIEYSWWFRTYGKQFLIYLFLSLFPSHQMSPSADNSRRKCISILNKLNVSMHKIAHCTRTETTVAPVHVDRGKNDDDKVCFSICCCFLSLFHFISIAVTVKVELFVECIRNDTFIIDFEYSIGKPHTILNWKFHL